MESCNLLISTGTGFEDQAMNEIWFNFLGLGDENVIISKSPIMGLLFVNTKIDPRKVIKYFQKSEEEERILPISNFNKNTKSKEGDSNLDYVQFIKKIIPIDSVVNSEIDEISKAAIELYDRCDKCKDPNSKFRISIRKRHTNLETKDIIPPIANEIENKVDLQNYDWFIQIEIVGNWAGISILTPDEIFEPLIHSKKV